MRAILMLAALLVAGCASDPAMPHFTDVPSALPFVEEITVTSRVKDAETVRTECYMRARESGTKTTPDPVAPACSWREKDGRIILLSSRASSFNEVRKMVSKGHELDHWHEGKDHQ